MNERQNSRHSAPQPLCTAFEPLLPLLSLGKLEPDETAHIREHVATCTFCQSQLVEFETVRDALRRLDTTPVGAAPEVLVSLESILGAADSVDGDDEQDDQAEVPPLGARHGTLRNGRRAAQRGGRARLSALGALAAVLILAVLATAIFTWLRPPSQGITVPGLGTLVVFRLPVAHSQPRTIIAGRDGNLWFAENSRIGRITPQGTITEFSLPDGVLPYGLAAGSDGTLWFADGTGKVGRLNPRNGSVAEFALPDGMVPGNIVAAPDGTLWFWAANISFNFNESQQPKIARITPQGQLSFYSLPARTNNTYSSLVVGPDGDLWLNISGGDGDAIGRMSLTGVMLGVFPVPSFSAVNIQQLKFVIALTAGPDGNLWYTANGNQIYRVTPQGRVTEFPVAGSGVAGPIVAGSDGNLWFVAGDEHTVGRITPEGAITEFALPTGVTLVGITFGSDGNLWFADTVANTIDRLALHR